MFPNNNVRIVFRSDIDKAKNIFAYVLLTANEHQFFNPKLSKGDLFDLYENIMVDYYASTGQTFNIDDSAQNMKEFFESGKNIDELTKDVILEVFEENLEVTDYMEKHNLNTSVMLEFPSDSDGTLVLELPISGEDYHKISNNGEVDTFNSQEPFDDAYFSDYSAFMQDNEDGGGFFDYKRFTATDERVVPEKVFSGLIGVLQKQTKKNPVIFNPVHIRLRGAKDKEIESIHKQIVVVIDIISSMTEYAYEPHWSDIFNFIYNLDGDSLETFTVYLTKQHQLLTKGSPEFTKYYEDVLKLQQHIADITRAKTSPFKKQLSPNSQLLLAFVDYFSQAATIEEDGEFFGEI